MTVGNEFPKKDGLVCNFHTHTHRCHHAVGEDREYVEAAISKGIKTLGFSDHSPYIFDGDYYSHFRMRPEEFEGYVQSLTALRDEYKKDIDIYIGVEAEYYPKYFARLCDFLSDYPLDYMIMGQHYLCNEYDGTSSCDVYTEEKDLERYVGQVIEGFSTGKFAYIAHPDIFRFQGDEKIYEKHMSRLCEAAKSLEIPLEINFLGIRANRHYPRKDFFRIAAEVGNNVIFGCDAHSPTELDYKKEFDFAMKEYVEPMGLSRIEKIKLTMRK